MQTLLDSKWVVFLKVAELSSLTRAALALNVPQPTISRQITALETECGARLFRRTGRGVALTEFGQQVLPQLAALSNEAERISDEIHTKDKVPRGEVRVGLLPSTVTLLASKLFATARERFPQVRLHLSEGSSAQLEEQLREGRLDFGLVLREGASAEADECILKQTALHLVGLREDAIVKRASIALSDLAGLPLVVPSRPHPLRVRLEALAEAKQLKLHFAVTADSIHLQHEIAAAGGGYAVSSAVFELHHHSMLAAAEIVEPRLLRSLVLASTTRRPNTLATREISRLIVNTVPGLLTP